MSTFVVLSLMRAPLEVVRETVAGIQETVPGIQTILSVNDVSGGEFWKRAQLVAKEREGVWVCVTTQTAFESTDHTYVYQQRLMGSRSALIYLNGYDLAMRLGADSIVEMDVGGSMDWRDVRKFVDSLAHADAVFSTRDSKEGGRIVNSPIQRRLLSKGGTWLSNNFLCPGFEASDMTSGFEAFKVDLLRKLFSRWSADQWLSVSNDAAHLFQTEIRAYAYWEGSKIDWLPIVFGAGKHSLPIKDWGYLSRCLRGFLQLRERHANYHE